MFNDKEIKELGEKISLLEQRFEKHIADNQAENLALDKKIDELPLNSTLYIEKVFPVLQEEIKRQMIDFNKNIMDRYFTSGELFITSDRVIAEKLQNKFNIKSIYTDKNTGVKSYCFDATQEQVDNFINQKG